MKQNNLNLSQFKSETVGAIKAWGGGTGLLEPIRINELVRKAGVDQVLRGIDIIPSISTESLSGFRFLDSIVAVLLRTSLAPPPFPKALRRLPRHAPEQLIEEAQILKPYLLADR